MRASTCVLSLRVIASEGNILFSKVNDTVTTYHTFFQISMLAVENNKIFNYAKQKTAHKVSKKGVPVYLEDR